MLVCMREGQTLRVLYLRGINEGGDGIHLVSIERSGADKERGRTRATHSTRPGEGHAVSGDSRVIRLNGDGETGSAVGALGITHGS